MADCKHCSREIPVAKNYQVKIYCDNICQMAYQSSIKVQQWLSGDLPGWTGQTRQLRDFVRNYIHALRGTACEECGWDKRHPSDGSVVTEIDHVDGDAENCKPENLRVLCPCCHALTPTFRARNKGSKRNR